MSGISILNSPIDLNSTLGVRLTLRLHCEETRTTTDAAETGYPGTYVHVRETTIGPKRTYFRSKFRPETTRFMRVSLAIIIAHGG